MPTERVVRTFVKVFPHALDYRDELSRILIGSEQPIEWKKEDMIARLRSPFSRSWLERGGVDINRFERVIQGATATVFTPEFDRSRITDTNTDLFPRDEFLVSPQSAVRLTSSKAP